MQASGIGHVGQFMVPDASAPAVGAPPFVPPPAAEGVVFAPGLGALAPEPPVIAVGAAPPALVKLAGGVTPLLAGAAVAVPAVAAAGPGLAPATGAADVPAVPNTGDIVILLSQPSIRTANRAALVVECFMPSLRAKEPLSFSATPPRCPRRSHNALS